MVKYGWHGLPVLAALVKDDKEERLFRSYSADCLGILLRVNGFKELQLYSELVAHKKPRHEQTAQEIIAHVKDIFSR